MTTKGSDAANDQRTESAALRWVGSSVLLGANRFADTTTVIATLRCGDDAAPPGGFAERLARSVPAIESLLREAAGPLELRGGLSTARLVAAIAQKLQQRVDCRSERSAAKPGPERGTFIAAAVSEYSEVGLLALGLAARVVADAWLLEPVSNDVGLTSHLEAFERFAKACLPEPVRRAIARAGSSRGIPWERMSRGPDIFRFGTGHLQRRTDLTTTSNTSRVHAWVTANKPLSNILQRKMGVPVPRQLTAESADAAAEAAKTIGYPVVVKPWRGSHGTGVSANLVSESEVREAYDRAAKTARVVLVAVEEFLPGEDYRLLFMNGEYVASCKRNPPQVMGDGERSVKELMEEANRGRYRPDGFVTIQRDYTFDEDTFRMLTVAGLSPESVPAAGTKVVLSSAANGGTTADTTAIMHPDNIAAAARAARIAGIDVCGIDFLLPDPTRSYKETGGGICEINTNPAPMGHIIADGGCHLEFLDRFVDSVISSDRRGRIPVSVSFGAPRGISSLVGQLLGGKGVAICSPESVRFDDYVVAEKPPWPDSGRWAVLDPGARWALLELSGPQILQHGLFVEWCDVAYLNDPSQPIDEGQSVALRLALTTVVWDQGLEALTLKTGKDARSVLVCARRPDVPMLVEHLRRNGRAVIADAGTFTLKEGDAELAQATSGALADAQRDAFVLAAAIAWGLGRDPQAIADAIRTLAARGEPSIQHAPEPASTAPRAKLQGDVI